MADNNPKTFSILSAWQGFLATAYPEGTKMKPVEYRKLKQAFYSAYGAALIIMRDEIAFLPQARTWEVIRELVAEATNFNRAKPIEEILSKEQLEEEVENE